MFKLEEFIKNIGKTSVCINIMSSLRKTVWDCKKGIGTGDKPLFSGTLRSSYF